MLVIEEEESVEEFEWYLRMKVKCERKELHFGPF
jgi:hypothetical protein